MHNGSIKAIVKPGIIYGNAMHATIGALLAFPVLGDWGVVLSVVLGVMGVVASAAAFNNYLDRHRDAAMKRTKERYFAQHPEHWWLAAVLVLGAGGFGFSVLYYGTNELATLLGVIAYIWYVFLYGYTKRVTVHNTLIGAVPGALPGVAGYVAISGELTLVACLIGVMLFLWQLPHFYAISVFRKAEYEAAGFPVLSSKLSEMGMYRVITASQMLYVWSAALLGWYIDNWVFTAGVVGFAMWWYLNSLIIKGMTCEKWARRVFGHSLVVTLSILLLAILAASLRLAGVV